MLRKFALYSFISLLVFANKLYSQDQYMLAMPSFDEGTIVNIFIRADAPDGVLVQKIDGENKQGTMSVFKEYKLERTTLANVNGNESKIRYNIISVNTDVKILYHGENSAQENNINLSDIQIIGEKNPSGDWRFSIEEGQISPDVKALMQELQAYENRKWFTASPVNIGDSWEIYPALNDFLMTRDLQHVETKGTMKLVDVSQKGKENIATLKFNATSQGWDENPATGSRKASFDSQGLLQYSLDQQLDTTLIIKSQLESYVQQDGATVSVILPFTYKVEKVLKQ